MTKFFTLLLACAVIISSCKTASKSYKKGDYTDAIERGVKKLQKDPNDYETRELVKNSYTYTVNEHEDNIRILSNSKAESRYEKIYVEYASLQNLYQTIHQSPAATQLVKPKDYSEFVETYKEKAAEVHLDKANKWMDEGTKQAYKEAYREFNYALSYRPEDMELRKQRDLAYDNAVTKVVISPMQSLGGYQYGTTSQLQNFQRDVIRTLSNNMNNDFVRFYTEYEARNQDVEADQILELNLNRISMGQPLDQKSTREVTKEVVIKEIVYKPDSIGKQYGTVKAQITTTKRTLLSQGDLFVIVRDTKGRTIWNDQFTGEHKWQTEFASYTGDERALSDSDKQLLNNNSTATPPAQEQVMDDLLRQIQTDLSQRLRGYYTRLQ
jgi:hypothetical protein